MFHQWNGTRVVVGTVEHLGAEGTCASGLADSGTARGTAWTCTPGGQETLSPGTGFSGTVTAEACHYSPARCLTVLVPEPY
jgi:hypothetical protein